MPQQGPPSSRRREARPGASNHWGSDPGPDEEEEYRSWAGMAVSPRRAAGEPAAQTGPGQAGGPGGQRAPDAGAGPGFRRRAGAARARRARLRFVIWGAAAVAVAAIVAVLLVQLGGHPAPRATVGGLVTTYQPGESRSVPSACTAVSAATLAQVMQGRPARLAQQSLDGAAQSVCDWTVDAPPVYRHLQVTLQAYAPSGLASGDGSATNAAMDAYRQALQQKAKPPKGSGLPRATVSQPGHLGGQAFIALQRVVSRGSVTDIETAVVRVHNVLVTVILQGSHTGRYGPVPVARLAAGAVAVARDVLSRLG